MNEPHVETGQVCSICLEGTLTDKQVMDPYAFHRKAYRIPLHSSVCDRCGIESSNWKDIERSRAIIDAIRHGGGVEYLVTDPVEAAEIVFGKTCFGAHPTITVRDIEDFYGNFVSPLYNTKPRFLCKKRGFQKRWKKGAYRHG